VVALTILINGSLSRSFYSFLYRKVHLQTAEADAVILHYVRKRIWQKAEIGEIPLYYYVCYLEWFAIVDFPFSAPN
jgi:hypothetical protein